MSKVKPNKKRGSAVVKTLSEICHDLRLKIEVAFERAADHARKLGQRIKVSIVRDDIRKYLNNGIVPRYVKSWMTHVQAQPA